MQKIITYHNNGSIKKIYQINQNNQKNGLHIRFYTDGKIADKVNYINNNKNGLYISYRINGDIWYKINYLNNKRIGIKTDYYNNKIRKQKYHI